MHGNILTKNRAKCLWNTIIISLKKTGMSRHNCLQFCRYSNCVDGIWHTIQHAHDWALEVCMEAMCIWRCDKRREGVKDRRWPAMAKYSLLRIVRFGQCAREVQSLITVSGMMYQALPSTWHLAVQFLVAICDTVFLRCCLRRLGW